MLTKIEQYLAGKKTYGLVGLGLVIAAAAHLGWIEVPKENIQELLNVVTLAAIAALRAGVK